MGKQLVTKIRGMNPLARRGTLLLLALLASFACLLGPRDAAAAPTISDQWSNVYGATTTATSININSSAFTVSSGLNRLLLVSVQYEGGTTLGTFSAHTVTYGGVTVTPIASTNSTSARVHTWLGYVKDANIPTGANAVNVTATRSAALSGVQIKVGSYTGVEQSSPITSFAANYALLATVAFPSAVAYQADSITVIASNNGGATAVFGMTGVAVGSTFNEQSGASSVTGGFSGFIAESGVNATAESYTTASTVSYTGGTSTRSSMVVAALNPYIPVTTGTTAGVATAVNGGLTTINVSAPYGEDSNADNTVLVEYKLSTDSTYSIWTGSALPHSATPYSTSITGLTSGLSYDVRITYQDADGVSGTAVQTITGITTAGIPVQTIFYMTRNTTTDLTADGLCNVTGLNPYTSTGLGKTTAEFAEFGTASRYYPATILGAGTILNVYTPEYTTNAVDISNISASIAFYGVNNTNTLKLDLYEYDPGGAAGNGTLVASSAAKTVTGGAVTTNYTWAPADFTINGTGRIAQGHRLQFRLTQTSSAAGTSRFYFGVAGATASTNFTVTQTPIAGNNSTTAETATAVSAGTTSISVTAPYTNDGNANNTLRIEYKLTAAPDTSYVIWTGSDLLHAASPYSAVITGLTKGSSYAVRVTYLDADTVSGTAVQTISGVIPAPVPVQKMYYMTRDTATILSADGTCNITGILPYTVAAGQIGKTTALTGEFGAASRYYPTTAAGTSRTVLNVYTPEYTTNAVDVSGISASIAFRGNAVTDTIKLDLYDYDPAGAANNGTLIASSAAKTVTGGTTTTRYTWVPGNFTINGTGTVALNHRLQFRLTQYSATTTSTSRLYFGVTGNLTSTNFTVTETPAVGANPTTAGTATATAAGATRISVSAPYTDDGNANNSLRVEYKLTADPDTSYVKWTGSDLPHSDTPYLIQIAGLNATTSYDVRVTYLDAVDGVVGTAVQVISAILTPEPGVEAYQNWSRVINDSTSHATGIPVNLSGNFAVTAPAGTNRLLVVAITQANRALNTAPATPSTITYGGVVLKFATSNRATSSRAHTWLYYLKDNAVMDGSSRPVAVIWAAGVASTKIDVSCAVFIGVDQIPANYTTGTQIVATAATTAMALNASMPVIAKAKAIYVLNVANVTNITYPTFATNANWTTPSSAAPTTFTGNVGSTYSYSIQLAYRSIPATDTTDAATTGIRNVASYYAMSAMVLPPVAVSVTTGAAAPNLNVYASDLNKVADAFTLIGSGLVSSIQVTGNVNTTSSNISAIRIYRKGDTNTTVYSLGVDTLVGSGSFGAVGTTPVNIAVNEAISGNTNYIIVYDIAAGAVANGTSITFTGAVTAMTPAVGSLTDSGATLTLYAKTLLGTGTEPLTDRLWTNSAPTRMNAFTLAHTGSATDDDTVTNITIRMSPKYITGGSGGTQSKFKALDGITITDSLGVKVSTAEVVCSTTAAPPVIDTYDTCTINTNIPVTSTPATYYVVVATANVINPSVADTSGTITGYYAFNGKVTTLSHLRSSNFLVLDDNASQTVAIDVETPLGPASANGNPGTNGGEINLGWALATDANSGALHPVTPYLIRRSAPDGTVPAVKCTEGVDLAGVPGVSINTSARTVTDKGLIDTSAIRYYYRICAKDSLGNISDGIGTFSNTQVTMDCNNPPEVTLTPVSQLIKSTNSPAFTLNVTNNDQGPCPDVTFDLSIVNEVGIVAHFDKSIPATLTVGSGSSGTGTPVGDSKDVIITGRPEAAQLETYKFAVRVSTAGDTHGAAVTSAQVTGLLNDMPPIVHNSANMGLDKYGQWGQTYTCATCHSNSTTNIKGVYTIISTPIGRRNVVFTKTSSVAADSNGTFSTDLRAVRNVSNNVCSVCHHRTTQHQYSANKADLNFGNGQGVTGPNSDTAYTTDHHNSRDCARCHTHNSAFRSITGVCGDCHGNKITGYFPVNKATMVHDKVTNALGNDSNYGAHRNHNNVNIGCGACHNTTNHGLDTTAWVGDRILEMGFSINKDTFQGFNQNLNIESGSTFFGTSFLSSPYVWSPGPGTTITPIADYNASCSTYCHGNWAGNSGSATTPIWVGTGQTACGTCHDASGSAPPASGSHTKHAADFGAGLGIACSKCHGTLSNFTGAAHVNGLVQWDMTAYPGSTYSNSPAFNTGNPAPTATFGTCNTLYCHSTVQGANGLGAPEYKVATWGGTAACGSCHVMPNNTGSHSSHINAEVSFDCHICHNTGGTTTALNHGNGAIDFKFVGLGQNTKYGNISTGTKLPGTGYGLCSTSDCHGRFTRAWGTVSSGLTMCDKCHGSATSPRGFYNTQGPDGTLSVYTSTIGVHDIHIQNLNSPRKATFSRFTSYAAGMSCKQCHSVPTGPFSPGHMDNALPAEVPFNNVSSIAKKGTLYGYYSSPKYTKATGTCSSIWCHGAGMNSNSAMGSYSSITAPVRSNPVWNAPFLTGNGSTDCSKCHSTPPPAPDSSYTHYGKTLTTCKDCHTHVSNDGHGFKNKVLHVNGTIEGNCNNCHGSPPLNNIPGDKDGLVAPPLNALNGGAGAHNAHQLVPSIGNNCFACHDNYTAEMPSNELEIGFGPLAGNPINGTMTGYSSSEGELHWKNSNASTTIVETPDPGVVCSNLYCHGGGTTTLPVLGGGNRITPDWEGTTDCGDCHGIDSGNTPSGGSHTRHAQLIPSLSCQTCHGTTSDNGTHVDAAVSWNLQRTDPLIGPLAKYNNLSAGSISGLAPRSNQSREYANCSNFYCHSNVQSANGAAGPSSYTSPRWGNNGTMNCSSCHIDAAVDAPAGDSHVKHANLTSGMGISCGYCHQDAGFGYALHTDGAIFVNFTSYIGGAYSAGTFLSGGMNKTAGSAAYGSCAATFCHGDAPSPTWGTYFPTGMECNRCHSAKVDDLSWSGRHKTHYNYSTMPSNYTQTVQDVSSVNKYRFNCAHCHDDNVAKHSLKPASADSAARVFFGISAASPASSSKRGTYAYGAPSGATDNGFNYTDGSCNGSYCHSNGRGGAPNVASLTWNTAPTTGSNCQFCHDSKSVTTTPTALSGKHDKHMNRSNNTMIAIGGDFNCVDCHAPTITNTSNIVIADKRNHVNKTLNYSSARAPRTGYTLGSGSCTTYCHSNGNPTALVFVSMTGSKVWSGSATITTCNKCHGRSTTNGAPDYAGGAAGTATANGHLAHIASGDATTVCSDCHWRTASKTIANKFVDYTAATTHLNGTPSVYFNRAKLGLSAGYNSGTCSSVICHGSGTPVWGPSSPTPKCEKCHGYRKSPWNALDGATATTDHRAGAHFSHISTVTYRYDTSYGCLECHSDSISQTTDSTNQANHFNNASSAKVNWTVGSPQAKLNGQTPVYSPTTKGCSSVYCHGSGMASNISNPPASRVAIPAWKTPFLNGTTSTIGNGSTTPGSGNCSKCHGFPPMTATHAGKGIASCNGCHSHVSITGLAFLDASKHIDGTVQASGGHVYSYRGSVHKNDANAAAPYTNCNGCHNATTAGGTLVKGTAPNCGACHINMTNFTGTTPGCYDCHGSSATGGRPALNAGIGNVFPNISGSHGVHVVGQGLACDDCHSNGGSGRAKHGSYSSVAHTKSFVNVTSTMLAGKIFTFRWAGGSGMGTCSNISCHPPAEWGVTKMNCLTCHSSVINSRAAVTGQFASQSHHVQGVELPLTTLHCAKCHWEAKSDGSVDKAYHSGTSGKGVSLIVWNSTTRPASPVMGTTYISYTANGSRAQISKLNSHCESCHNTPNAAIAPFGSFQTTQYSPEPKMVPALAKTSIQSRYSSTRTVAWSNYTFTNSSGQIFQYGTNKKNQVTKALSAHGNAIKNQFPNWVATANGTGEDETMADIASTSAKTDTRRNVFCYDCHNSHGSDAAGITSSYSSATGRYKGGLLKSTVANVGGYTVTYKPAARTINYKNYSTTATGPALFNSGASICNDCHNNDTRKVNISRPWSITGTYSSTKAIVGYWSTPYFDNYTFASAKRTPYKAGGTSGTIKDLRKPMGGHYGSSVNGTQGGHSGEINGLCTPCHDPHGVSSAMSAVNRGKSVPLLKGTWVTSPYREDRATPMVKRGGGSNFTGVANMGAMPGYNIDQNTLIALPAPTAGGAAQTTAKSNQRKQAFTVFPGAAGSALAKHTEKTPADFAGLCIGCHAQATLTNATAPSATNWKSKERVHQSVAGWAATTGTNANGTVHAYTCSKCHAPHVSRLPRLLITNCLDVRHVKQSVAAPAGTIVATPPGSPGFGFGNVLQSYASSAFGAGRFPGGGSRYSSTPGSAQNNGPWYFQTVQPAAVTYGSNCHNATNAGGATWTPANQIWNKKSRW